MNSSQRLRILLISGLVGANAVVLALSGYSLYQSRQQYELRARTATQNIASALDQNVSNSIEKIDLALRTVVDEFEHQLAGKGLDEQAANTFLARHEQRLPELEAFRVADAEGFVIVGKGVVKQDRVTWADRDYFIYHRDHAEGKLHTRKPRMGRVAKQYIVNFSRRFNYPDGRFAGVISAPIAVDHFSKLLSQYDLGPKGTLILRDADLGLITRSPPIPDQPAGQIGHAGVSTEFRRLVESGVQSATYHITNSPDGFERILTFRRLERGPMIAIVGTASDDYLAAWTAEFYKTSALTFGFLVLSGLLGTFLFRMLAQSEIDQARLRESESRLRTIIENEPECIKIVDADGKLLQMNPAGLAMIEAESLEQVAGHPVLEVIAPEYRTAFAEMHRRIIGGEPMQQEFEVLGLKGGRRLLETHAVPMLDNGTVVHLAVTRDISERRAYENELKQAKAVADAANLAKSAFLATMSHEIRTPMNGILGMAQMLMMTNLSESERMEYARTVHNSGQTLLRLLNDILDLSKVEAGKLELTYAAFNPRQIVDETAALFAEHAHSKGLQIAATWRGPGSQRYLGDAIRLRQMVSNLISNAIKFTAKGHVRLEVTEVERNGNHALIEFAVMDSGIGIPPDRQSLLFKPFSQADSSTTREYGGTGLGLSIIRSLAKLMGGEVGLESEEGKGSRFWFTLQAEVLPAGEDSRKVERSVGEERQAGNLHALTGDVLVVEDNPTNRKVIEALLGKLGIKARSVENGQQAVDIVRGGLRPDLVLMDVQMPVMDGIKATEVIRQWEQEASRPHLKIIALTAGAFDEDRQHCIAAGMDDFLTKPVNLNDLASMLEKWLGQNGYADDGLA
jgi:PAS domain S-box-containing protein